MARVSKGTRWLSSAPVRFRWLSSAQCARIGTRTPAFAKLNTLASEAQRKSNSALRSRLGVRTPSRGTFARAQGKRNRCALRRRLPAFWGWNS